MNDEPTLYREPGISAGDIDPEAMAVVRRIARAGAKARFVGGCVRDLLLGRRPKDFDVVTPLSLRRVRRIFGTNSRIIGRRHRLVHVFYSNGKIIEVSTYPRPGEQETGTIDCEVLDARQRDFTINALYYDPIDDSLIDYVKGYDDIRSRVLRCVGSPREKFQEDPVRTLRGIRYACLLEFKIEVETWKAIVELVHTVTTVNKARMREEIWKFLLTSGTDRSFRLFADLGIFSVLFPELTRFLDLARADRLWNYLAAKNEVPREELTHSLALAVLHLPLLDEIEELGPGSPGKKMNRLSARCHETIESISRNYSLASRVRDEAVALLKAQLHFLRGPDWSRASERSSGSRRGPIQSLQFEEAFRLFRVLNQARGTDGEAVRAWEDEARRRRAEPHHEGSTPGRKRRRRRGPRRRA